MLLSLILYGSRARGDHRITSDVDLLGITESGAIHREVTKRGVSLYKYPYSVLMQKAQGGDLFMLHICREGLALHDTVGLFDSLVSNYNFKNSYEAEIKEASAILWFLLDRNIQYKAKKTRKRLIWAIRTVLIARAAEHQQAIFSAKELEEYSKIEGLKAVIDRRTTIEAEMLTGLALEVVSRFGWSKLELELGSSRVTAKEMNKFGRVARVTPMLLKRSKVTAVVEPVDWLMAYE